MNASELRNYAARDWHLIEQTKADYWTEQKATLGPSGVLAQAAELLEYVRILRPDWPSSAERDADVDAHIRLAEILHRAFQERAR